MCALAFCLHVCVSESQIIMSCPLGTEPGSPEEQSVLLTTKSSSQPLVSSFLFIPIFHFMLLECKVILKVSLSSLFFFIP